MIRPPRALARALAVLAAAWALAGCATTIRDDRPAEPTWRSGAPPASAPAPDPALDGARLTAYVASFGLAESVAERHPELLEARAGLGLAQRVADALYESGRFRFLEEKAEMAARLADLRVRAAGEDGPAPAAAEAARWLLYGELVDVQVARDERVAGWAGRAEGTTRATVQIRLVDREGGAYLPATATGSAASPPDGLDARALADATGEAVRAAAAELMARLEGE